MEDFEFDPKLIITIVKGLFILGKNLSPIKINFSSDNIEKTTEELDENWKNFWGSVQIQELTFEESNAIKYIDKIIKKETPLNRVKAQVTPVDHRGIIFLGPSGAGKTSLINAFIDCKINPSQESTIGIKRIYITLLNKVTCIRDSFGRTYHQGDDKKLMKECIEKPPKIVCLVFANSYLQSKGDNNFHRGSINDFQDQGIDEYLKFTKREEITWVKDRINEIENKDRKGYINQVIIVVNKMDLWCDDINKYNEVKADYIQNKEIKKLARLLVGNPNYTPYFLGVSSEYNSFMQGEIECVKRFNSNVSLFSIILLRAFILDLLRKIQ